MGHKIFLRKKKRPHCKKVIFFCILCVLFVVSTFSKLEDLFIKREVGEAIILLILITKIDCFLMLRCFDNFLQGRFFFHQSCEIIFEKDSLVEK